MKESYKVRPSQSPWPRVMRFVGQPAGRSVHRWKIKGVGSLFLIFREIKGVGSLFLIFKKKSKRWLGTQGADLLRCGKEQRDRESFLDSG